MKPVIGITCDYEAEGMQPYSFTYRDYSDAIIAAHGIPVLLPVMKDTNTAGLLLEKIDGLLLTGGDDVPPQRYGEEPHKKTICIHPDRDIFDHALICVALRMKKPVLAICYGAQLVNVVLGGSLIQDIQSEGMSPLAHKDLRNRRYTHTVTVEKNSILYKIIGKEHVETNSVHHQAIRRLGKGLKGTARTPDGIIEAVELQDYPFLVGVQWHPERMADFPCHAALFRALVKASVSR